MNWENISEFDIEKAQQIANLIQAKRDDINKAFKEKNKFQDIGLTITSGFRCKAWEAHQGRSGNSRHTQSDAMDIQPIKCSKELAVEILQYLFEKGKSTRTGHLGGFAIKKPSYKDGKVMAVGFLHYDLRGVYARWEY